MLRIAGGVIGLGIVVVVMANILGGRSVLPVGTGDPEGTEIEQWREELENLAKIRAQEIGLRESWMIVYPPGSPEGDSLLTVIECRVPGDIHLEVLNLALTQAVNEAGGSVVRGIEINDARVELEVAFKGRRTHRLILQRYSGYSSHAGMIGLIIDDFGTAPQSVLNAFANLSVPWTATIIPGTASCREQARFLSGRDIPLMIHMPMEPVGDEGWDLGDGAIYASTPRDDVDRLVARALEDVPGATGLNNHMGSRVTAEHGVMRALMASLKERGLFFIDSGTTAASVAMEEADRAGIACARRDVFLDPENDPAVIEQQFMAALEHARENGSVILLGHPRQNTLEALRRLLPRAREEGFEFVTVDRLLSRPGRLQ